MKQDNRYDYIKDIIGRKENTEMEDKASREDMVEDMSGSFTGSNVEVAADSDALDKTHKLKPSFMNTIPTNIIELLEKHKYKIQEAFEKKEENEALTIAFSIKMTPEENGIKCDIGISYTAEKIKETRVIMFDKNQLNLFMNN